MNLLNRPQFLPPLLCISKLGVSLSVQSCSRTIFPMVCSWPRFQLHTVMPYDPMVMPEDPIYPIYSHIISPCWLNHHSLLQRYAAMMNQRTEPRIDAIFGLIPDVVPKISAYLKNMFFWGEWFDHLRPKLALLVSKDWFFRDILLV